MARTKQLSWRNGRKAHKRKRKVCVVTVIAWTEDDRDPEIFTMRPGRDERDPDSVCVQKVADRLKRIDHFTLLFFDVTNEEWQECKEGERICVDGAKASIFVRVLGVERCARFGYYLEQASSNVFGDRELADNIGAPEQDENTPFIAGTGARVVRTLAWLEIDEEPEVFPIRLDFNDRVLVRDIQKACSDTSIGLFSWDHATTQWTFYAPESSIRVFKFHSAILVKAPDVGTCIYAGREIRRLQHEAVVGAQAVSDAQEANVCDMTQRTNVSHGADHDVNVIEQGKPLNAQDNEPGVNTSKEDASRVSGAGDASLDRQSPCGVTVGNEPDGDGKGEMTDDVGNVIWARPAKGEERRRYVASLLVEKYLWQRRSLGHDNTDLPEELKACFPERLCAPLGQGDTCEDAIEVDY